jgi:hypothetical protein
MRVRPGIPHRQGETGRHRVNQSVSLALENPATLGVHWARNNGVNMERLQGWHPDPTGRHQERYFSQGAPTHLYRDGKTEGYDDRASFPALGGGPREVSTTRGSAPPPSDAPSEPPHGWYPDPLDGARLRVWDGSQWGEQTRPRPSVAAEEESGSSAPIPGVAQNANGAHRLPARFCTHCGAPLAEGNGRWVGDSQPSDPVSAPIHAPHASQADPQPTPARSTVGRDQAVALHNGAGSIDDPDLAHAGEPGRRWGDDPVRVATNGANGAPVKALHDSTPTWPSAVVPNLVPGPGWYPVQGSPELLRWWDGSEWGVVREVSPAAAESQTTSWQSRQ